MQVIVTAEFRSAPTSIILLMTYNLPCVTRKHTYAKSSHRLRDHVVGPIVVAQRASLKGSIEEHETRCRLALSATNLPERGARPSCCHSAYIDHYGSQHGKPYDRRASV